MNRRHIRDHAVPILSQWPVVLGQIRQIHRAKRMKNGQSLDQIGQFPNIARPAPLAQGNDCGRRQAHRRAALMLQARNDFFQQQGQIFNPIAQRRCFNGKHIEPVVKIFPELALGNLVFQHAMRGGNDPYIGGNTAVAPHPLKHPFLQHPQQLHLHRQAHVANLIKKQGAALSSFKSPFTVAHRAGKCAFFVTEEFRFQQFTGYRAAIDGDEWPIAA